MRIQSLNSVCIRSLMYLTIPILHDPSHHPLTKQYVSANGEFLPQSLPLGGTLRRRLKPPAVVWPESVIPRLSPVSTHHKKTNTIIFPHLARRRIPIYLCYTCDVLVTPHDVQLMKSPSTHHHPKIVFYTGDCGQILFVHRAPSTLANILMLCYRAVKQLKMLYCCNAI